MNSPDNYEPMPQYFSLRVALVYGIHFIYFGIYIPYFPLWLEDQNLTAIQISTVLAIALVVRVFTSGQVTSFADKQPDRAKILSWLYLFSAISVLLYLPSNAFWPILIVSLIYNFFYNPIMPLLDAYTMSGENRFGANYGNIRLWGSLVFIITNIAGGFLLAGFSSQSILWAIIFAMWAGFLISFLLPRIGRRNLASQESILHGSRSLWRDKRFLLVLISAGLAQASHALIYGFGSIYWINLGFSTVFVGVLWAVGVFAEIALFYFSKRLLKRYIAISFIALGCVGGFIRWMLFPLFDDGTAFLLLQILHGASFGAVHIGTMYFISQSVPDEKLGAAQGVGFVLAGTVMGVAVFLSGPVYNYFGGNGFFIMAAMSLLALIILWVATIFYPQSSGVAGDTLEPS